MFLPCLARKNKRPGKCFRLAYPQRSRRANRIIVGGSLLAVRIISVGRRRAKEFLELLTGRQFFRSYGKVMQDP